MNLSCLMATDSHWKVGLGHVKRQLNLARTLKTRGHNPRLFLRRDGYRSSEFDFVIGDENEFRRQLALSDVVIIDDHGFPEFWLDSCRAVSVLIDETGPLRGRTDVHFLTTLAGLKSQKRPYQNSTEWIGVEYFIFDPDITSFTTEQKEGLFISFGGTDPQSISLDYMNHCPEIPAVLAIGQGFTLELENILTTSAPSSVTLLSRPASLLSGLAKARFCLCSGGVTAYEALFLGCRVMIISQNEEQARTARMLAEAGLVIYLGQSDQVNWARIAEILQEKDEERLLAFHKFRALVPEIGNHKMVEKIEQYVQYKSLS